MQLLLPTSSSDNTFRPAVRPDLPYSITYTDRTQFAPRVGFAWQPLGTGHGDSWWLRYLLRTRGNQRPCESKHPAVSVCSETVNQTQNVVPNRTTANFFLGSQLGSALANPSILPTLTHLKMGQNQHYSLSVQQQLSPKTVFDIAYVGNHGLHLQATDDFNDPTPAAGRGSGTSSLSAVGHDHVPVAGPWNNISSSAGEARASCRLME